MTEDEVRKIAWAVLTEFEKIRGQLEEIKLESELKMKKEEFELITNAMKEIAEMGRMRDDQLFSSLETIAKGLKTVATRTIERLEEIEKLLVAKLDKREGGDA